MAEASYLKRIVDGWIVPTMREAGWRRSGMKFSRRNELDDVALVGVQVLSGNRSDVAEFCVNVAVSPLPYRRFFDHMHPGGGEVDRPDASVGMYMKRIMVPAQFTPWPESGRPDATIEVGDEALIAPCGEFLAAELRENVVPLVEQMLDRDRLLSMLTADPPVLHVREMPPGPVRSRVVLQIEDPSCPDLYLALDEARAEDDTWVVEWAESVLAGESPGGAS